VLVEDDNATTRRILEETLLNWQMRPVGVDSGRAALAALREARAAEQPFALVLLDGQMPEMDGFTVAEQIKRDPELDDTVILMLTSAGQPGDAARCRALGVAAYLTKPVKQADLARAIGKGLGIADAAEPRPADAPRTTGERPLRILLAEDSLVNQKLVLRLLEKHGHAVTVAGTGREALAALERQRFDVVLMDVQMPEMDGFEATHALRLREATTGGRVPVIAMTAYAMKGDRERCLEAGMDAYVSKPIGAAELFGALEAVLPRPAAPPVPPPTDALDWSAALARVAGDGALLKEMIALFGQECPGLLRDLRDAVAGQDAAKLKRAAHTLKGSLDIFAAKPAFAAALTLETMGRTGNLAGAGEALTVLEAEMRRLEAALTGNARELVTAGC
jgi:CheY-like chemotaxis protein